MKPFVIPFLFFLLGLHASARVVEHDLVIAEASFSPAGRVVNALKINGGIPGPTLRYTLGDVAVIRVHNRLKDESTSTHWHGLLLPNEQDGVPHLTTPPIMPGETHTFTFPLKHVGTYWYHSHTGLQEQRGIYGAIVVEPVGGLPEPDHVLVLSDWTNEHPKEVMKTLKRGSEFYALKKGVAPSVMGAHRAGQLGAFFRREWSRMPPMDLSDIGYDAFFINGTTSSRIEAAAGERVRLRIINAGASSYFYTEFSGGPMTVVAADGPDVKPFEVSRLLLGMAETYDVLVTVPPTGTWEFRATAQDGSGHASAWLGQGEARTPAPDVPRADVYNMDALMMSALADANLQDGSGGGMTMSMDGDETDADAGRPLPPYRRLRSPRPTAFQDEARVLTYRLTGDMERYIWSFNRKALHEDPVILVEEGEIVRMVFVNDTMMHHPIHLHGHFFRLLNGQGAHAPMKHTVDVPPMSKRVIEFKADEPGDWFLHCHLLYHMMSGMTRVVSYKELGSDHRPNLGPHAKDHFTAFGEARLLTHMSEGELKAVNTRNDLRFAWEADWDGEFEADATWDRYVGPNLKTFAGARLAEGGGGKTRGIAGVRYRLPGRVLSELGLDTKGDVRASLEKDLLLTDRLGVFAELEADTGSDVEAAGGFEWRVNKPLSLLLQAHSEYGGGVGATLRF